jgi:hypothetical protein
MKLPQSRNHQSRTAVFGAAPLRSIGRSLSRLFIAISLLVIVIVGGPRIASADATNKCDPSQFTDENGFDITSYELCRNPQTDGTEYGPGAPVEFKAAGFAHNSEVAIYLHRVGCGDGPECELFIGYGHADENGVLIFDFDLPAGLDAGGWEIVAEGVDPDGNPLQIVSDPISVVDDVPDSGSLPYTGSKSLRLTTIGAALFVLGGAAVASTRRIKQVRR